MKRKPKFNLEAHRHVAAIAWDLWLSDSQCATVAKTLGTNNPDYYLANRLAAAFNGGWDAAERHYKHIIEGMRKL